ncbi:MAG: translation initiation factor IF-6 [Methanobacteriota archaeon]
MLQLLDFNENPNLGVYCRANDSVVFVQKQLGKKIEKQIAETLGVKVVGLSIYDATIIGSLLVMNSSGAIVTDFADKGTIKTIEAEGFRVYVIKDIINAAGNDILVNDTGALVHPEIRDPTIRTIEKTLGVPVSRGTIAGLSTVGMAAVVTNKGCLCHPKVTDDEKQVLHDVFGVEVMIGTVNHGFPMIGSGLVANSKGAIIGNQTTGIEMGRIEEALGFLP